MLDHQDGATVWSKRLPGIFRWLTITLSGLKAIASAQTYLGMTLASRLLHQQNPMRERLGPKST